MCVMPQRVCHASVIMAAIIQSLIPLWHIACGSRNNSLHVIYIQQRWHRSHNWAMLAYIHVHSRKSINDVNTVVNRRTTVNFVHSVQLLFDHSKLWPYMGTDLFIHRQGAQVLMSRCEPIPFPNEKRNLYVKSYIHLQKCDHDKVIYMYMS